MTEQFNADKCTQCGHIFNPKEHRWSLNGSKGPQRCYECAQNHNARAAILNFLRWDY